MSPGAEGVPLEPGVMERSHRVCGRCLSRPGSLGVPRAFLSFLQVLAQPEKEEDTKGETPASKAPAGLRERLEGHEGAATTVILPHEVDLLLSCPPARARALCCPSPPAGTTSGTRGIAEVSPASPALRKCSKYKQL